MKRPHPRLLKQAASTSTTDFVEGYHRKNKHQWSNKVAYLAGLIDGEGYFKQEKHGTIRLVVGMTHQETIEWIHHNFGGTVTVQKTPKGGPFHVWRMNQGRDLFYLMLFLIPFLVTKKQVAIDALTSLIEKFSALEHTTGRTASHLEKPCLT